jgi:hypothetical protein
VQHPTHAALLAGVAPLFVIILLRHAGPLRELLAARRQPDA